MAVTIQLQMLFMLFLLCVLVASYTDSEWEKVRQEWEDQDQYAFQDRFPFETVRYTVEPRDGRQVAGRFVIYGNRIHLGVPFSDRKAFVDGACRVYRRRASFSAIPTMMQGGSGTTHAIAFCWREETQEHWMIAGERLPTGEFQNAVALVRGPDLKLLFSLESPLLNMFEPTGFSTYIMLNGEPKRIYGRSPSPLMDGYAVVDDVDTTSKGVMQKGKLHGAVEIHDHREGRVFRGRMDNDVKTGWWTSEPFGGVMDVKIEFNASGEPIGDWKKIE